MHIFCDFDGTISTVDTTDLILTERASPAWRAIEAEWEAGTIDAATCMRRQIALVRGPLSEIDALIDTIALRDGFLEFAAWAEREAFPITIVSDGIDYVIHGVLRRHGLALPVVTNRLVLDDAAGFALEQPHARANCGSGVCKCAIVEAAATRAPIVFVGDGRSDFCVAAQPDLLFATGRLVGHCAERMIPCVPFEDFRTVRAALDAIRTLPSLQTA